MTIRRTSSMSKYVKPMIIPLTVISIGILSMYMGLNLKQIIVLSIFTLEMTGIILYWELKLAFATSGVFLLFLTGALSMKYFAKFIYVDVLLFLLCMMIVVKYLEDRGFFELMVFYLTSKIRNAYILLASLMVITAILSSLVGVITAALFIVPIILRLTLRYHVDSIPFILMVVFAANVGSGATPVGSPVGIIFALRVGLSFSEFIRWSAPISYFSLAVIILYCFKMFSEDLRELNERMKLVGRASTGYESSINRAEVLKCTLLIVSIIISITFHHDIERLLELERGTALIISAMGGAFTVLFMERRRIRDIIEVGVDWYTLLFFAFLFASLGALEHVKINELFSHMILYISGEETLRLLFLLSWSCGVLSAFLDNVLVVAFFISVIRELQMIGVEVYSLWWGTLFAATYFGNATIIASTANIVAVSMLESRRAGRITFLQWSKYGLIVSILSLSAALTLLYVQNML